MSSTVKKESKKGEWAKHLRKDGKRTANKVARQKGKKETKKIVKEHSTNHISNFISCLTRKNYAKANKYLSMVVEDKIRKQIGNSLNKPLF